MLRTYGSFENYWRKDGFKYYGSGCLDWAKHPSPSQLAYFESKYGNGQQRTAGDNAGNESAAAIVSVLITGFAGGFLANSFGGGGGHFATTSNNYYRGIQPIRSQSFHSRQFNAPHQTGTPPQTNTSGVNVGRNGAILNPVVKNGRASYIGLDGKVHYTTNKPCSHTVQTGTTSYACAP